jgi:hypothetical protein
MAAGLAEAIPVFEVLAGNSKINSTVSVHIEDVFS